MDFFQFSSANYEHILHGFSEYMQALHAGLATWIFSNFLPQTRSIYCMDSLKICEDGTMHTFC